MDLDEAYAFAIQLGKDAGAMLTSAAQARFKSGGGGSSAFEEKDSAVDIVTKTDEGKFYRSHLQLRSILPALSLCQPFLPLM